MLIITRFIQGRWFNMADIQLATKIDLDKKADETYVNGELDKKVDNSRVLTDVPANAKFTDTVTTINGKTGAISKADIVALGIPAQDTVYTHPENHPATMITGLHTIATSGSYNDLSNKPDIPAQLTKLSELTNDSGFIDGAYDNSVSGLTATTIQAAIDELKMLIDGLASSGE